MRPENSLGIPAITFSNRQSLNLLSYFLDDVIFCILVYVISGGSREGARGGRPPPLCLDRTKTRGAENFFWNVFISSTRVFMQVVQILIEQMINLA